MQSLCCCVESLTINDKSLAREKFRGLLECRENFRGFTSSVLKVLPLFKVFVGKTFAIHQKSVKTAKLFYRVALIVYGIYPYCYTLEPL